MPPKAKDEKDEKDGGIEVETQEGEAAPAPEIRDVVVSIEVTCRTDSPDVTDDQIAAAAQEQVTLPNTIWIDKPAGGQIGVAVISAVQEPEDPPPAP
jgi:hypothetical protein